MVGKLSEEVLEAVLETVPVEFSVIDAEDKVLAWNKHESRIFKRRTGVLGRDVRDCHPKRSLHKVEALLQQMKEGKRDKARFWIDLGVGAEQKEQKVLIEYFALRGNSGQYLGCLEVTQDITELQGITGEKRLLD